MCFEENRSGERLEDGRGYCFSRGDQGRPQTSEEVSFGQDLEDKELAWKHLGKSIPDSTGTAKALRLELAELVLRRTRRLV